MYHTFLQFLHPFLFTEFLSESVISTIFLKSSLILYNWSAFLGWQKNIQTPELHLFHHETVVQWIKLAEFVSAVEQHQPNVLLLRSIPEVLQPLSSVFLGFLNYKEQIISTPLDISTGLAFNEERRARGRWCRCRSLCRG